MASSAKILFIATSHDKLGETNYRTGVWLEELAVPYYLFTDAGFELTMASPQGGAVPLDPKSESIIMATQSTKRFLKDEQAIDFITRSIPLEEIKTDEFDAVLIPGGHGCLWDLSNNSIIKLLLEIFISENKPVATIGHGIAALLTLQDDDGALFIKGKKVAATSNNEEESSNTAKTAPFLLETTLTSLGAEYSKAVNYVSHVVVDGNIITGQNAASSAEVAKKMITLVQEIQQRNIQQPEIAV